MTQKAYSHDVSNSKIIRRLQYTLEIDYRNIIRLTRTSLLIIIQYVANCICDNRPPSPSTLRRWYRLYHDTESIFPQKASRRKRRLSQEALTIMHKVISDMLVNPKRLSIQHEYIKMVLWIRKKNQSSQMSIEVPSKTTFYGEVRKMAEHEKREKQMKGLASDDVDGD